MTARSGHFDFVVPRGPSADGRGAVVARFRDEGASLHTLCPLEDGRPLPVGGEVVRLRRRGEREAFDVETLYRTSEDAAAERSGPPKVVSDAYRDGWDAAFGGRHVAPLEELN